MNPLKQRREYVIGSRVTTDTKEALEDIKARQGYSSGDLLEMTANNLIYNEKHEIRNSLDLIVIKRDMLGKYYNKVSKVLLDMDEELSCLDKQAGYLKEQLDLHGYTEDEELMQAKDAYLEAIARRHERMKVSFDAPVSSDEELLISIANSFGVKPVMLKKVLENGG